MPKSSNSSVDALRHNAGSPTGTGMICECDAIIGIPASRNARRVLSICSRWAIRSATDLFRCAMLCVAAAAIAGGIAVVKMKARRRRADRVANHGIRGNITSDHTEAFRQGSFDYVDAVHDPVS